MKLLEIAELLKETAKEYGNLECCTHTEGADCLLEGDIKYKSYQDDELGFVEFISIN